MNNSDPSLFVFLLAFIAIVSHRSTSNRHISLERHKFWSLVHSQEKPIVFLTPKGYLIKRLHYVFPYQGILFYTDARNMEVPDGVTLIGTGDFF